MSINLATLWPEQVHPQWPSAVIAKLVLDSRCVSTGNVFFALQGSQVQPAQMADFIHAALAQGALAVFTEVSLTGFEQQPVFSCPSLRQWVGVLAQRLLQAQAIQPLPQITAVTGTNGKTTICRLLAELFYLNGAASAVMGTTGNGILPHIEPSTHTTLDAIQLQQQLYNFARQGAQYVCLEASSHGLDQGRLSGAPVSVAIFSNLTRDHLDYHGTLESYAQAKAKLFSFPDLKYAILNQDDPAWIIMQQALVASQHALHEQAYTPAIIWTYSLNNSRADFYVQQVSYTLAGALLTISTPLGEITLQSPLLGRFNVSNILAVIAGAMAGGMTLTQIQQWVPQLHGAPGRMQVIEHTSRLFVVDYAHTPDALTQVLSSLRHHVVTGAKLWVVFGCGGDRDRGKRPLMTQAALALADQVILTADNPRNEAVDQILNDMLQDLTLSQQAKLTVQVDRRLAIGLVAKSAQPQDIVVIAGKGHEDYQEIEGVRHWFDDVVELKAALSHVQPPHNCYPV